MRSVLQLMYVVPHAIVDPSSVMPSLFDTARMNCLGIEKILVICVASWCYFVFLRQHSTTASDAIFIGSGHLVSRKSQASGAKNCLNSERNIPSVDDKLTTLSWPTPYPPGCFPCIHHVLCMMISFARDSGIFSHNVDIFTPSIEQIPKNGGEYG